MSKLKIPEPDLQISFYHRLQEIRRTHLVDALLATVAGLEITQIDQQLAELTSNSGLQKVAGWGLRGELVYAVPRVLAANPRLLGYYRLLLGFTNGHGLLEATAGHGQNSYSQGNGSPTSLKGTIRRERSQRVKRIPS